MPKLTVRTIKAIKPLPHRVEYLDSAVPGLALRVAPSGRMVWTLLYRNTGARQRRYTIARYPVKGLKEARIAARALLNRVSDQHDPAEEKRAARKGDTFGDLAKEYLTKHAKKLNANGQPQKRSWRQDEWLIDGRLAVWKPRKVKDIARRDVRTLLDQIAAEAPVLANRTLALVRKMFNFAIERDWLEMNPAWKLPKPGGAERPRERVLSDSEIREVWTAADGERQALATLTKLEFLTALRSGELVSMRHAELELTGGWWVIPGDRTKNGIPHHVPLVPPAVKLLKALPIESAETNPDGLVFPGRMGGRPLTDAKKAAPRICARVNDARQKHAQPGDPARPFHYTAHDIRRTVTTKLAEGGVSRFIIDRLLNHKDKGATPIYDRYAYANEKRAALQWWSARLDGILKGKKVSKVVPFAKHA